MKRIALLAVLLSSCGQWSPEEPTTPVLNLQAYDVPEAHAERLASTLNVLLKGSGEHPIGSARLGPGGTILVAAPPSVIRGVSDIISQVKNAEIPPPPKNIAVSYWLVEGTAGEFGYGPELESISKTLVSITEAEGPQRYKILSTQRIASLEGELAQARTADDRGEIQFDQRIVRDPQSGAYIGEIEVVDPHRFGRISTRIALDPSQTAVLGATTTADNSSLYIVVRPGVL